MEKCSRCRAACAAVGSDAAREHPDAPALARDDQGRAVCDNCVALETRWAIADGRPAVGYVNSDGTAVTSWGGAHVARIVRSSRLRSTFGGDGLAWSAELPSGAKCYGRNAGRGLVTNIHAARGNAGRVWITPEVTR